MNTDKEPVKKVYKFRAEHYDDVISFIAQVEPELIRSISSFTTTEPETLDMLARFKTAKTLDEMYKMLDELDKADGIYNSKIIRDTLELEQETTEKKLTRPNGIGATDWIQ